MAGIASQYTGEGVQFISGQPYYDHVLTNYFMDLLPDARNESSVLLSMIEKTGRTPVSGRFLVWPTLYGRNTGVNNVGFSFTSAGTTRGGRIPDPGQRSAITASTRTRKGMARIGLDGDTLRHGKTNGGAYAEALKLEMEGIIKDITIDRARQVHNDGSGRVAEISSVATTTITLKVNSSIEGASNTRAAGTLDMYIEVGERLAAITSAGTIHGAAAQSGYYVIAVNVSGANVTIQVAATPGGSAVDVSALAAPWAANDWLVRCGVGDVLATLADTGFKNEIQGIGGVFSDIGVLDGGTASGSQQSGSYDNTNTATTWFQGIVCSTNIFNQGIVLDSSGAGLRPISEILMQQAISDAERINNANITTLFSHHETYNSYVQILTPDKRYQNTTDLSGGHTALSFNGLPWVKDRFCYQNRVYFLAMDQFEIAETQALQALVGGDVTVWERLADNDFYWRAWVWDDQLLVSGIRNRTGALLNDLAA